MLRRLSRQLDDGRDGPKLERKRSKRERISQLFRFRKQMSQQHNEALVRPLTFLLYLTDSPTV